MSAPLTRVHSATGTVALVLALLALVASSAGVGYAAGQISTDDIQNNAVTAKKIDKNAVTAKKIKKNAITSKRVKDGSLKPADLPRQEAQHKVTMSSNGGEGDCIWQGGDAVIPGVGAPTYRLDRNGRVILSGLAISSNGAGGDADCDPLDPGQIADGIAFTLPAAYIPAKTQYIFAGGITVIAGPQGYTQGATTIPPGSVFGDGGVLLDSIEYDPVGAGVVIAKMKPSGRWTGNVL